MLLLSIPAHPKPGHSSLSAGSAWQALGTCCCAGRSELASCWEKFGPQHPARRRACCSAALPRCPDMITCCCSCMPLAASVMVMHPLNAPARCCLTGSLLAYGTQHKLRRWQLVWHRLAPALRRCAVTAGYTACPHVASCAGGCAMQCRYNI
ncbi:hypothetical protein COO60DRAFT_980257 [Scenedesmus sp. NREL 46B-D3]|nr:hypothetical protein COO60DRAFT_980257 [Scenedesmus sp. NREL 46B-D3]